MAVNAIIAARGFILGDNIIPPREGGIMQKW